MSGEPPIVPAEPPAVPPGARGTATPPPSPPTEVAEAPAPEVPPETEPSDVEPSSPPPDASQPVSSSPAPPPAAPPPAARPSEPELPSAGRRVTVAVLVSVVLALLIVFLPVFFIDRIRELSNGQVTTAFATTTLVEYGLLVSVVYGVRSAVRPTRAFGPMSILASGLGIVYLLYLAPFASFTVDIGSGNAAGLDIGPLLRLIAIVPAFGVLAGVVTTAEDFARPGERLRIDYPARL